MDAVDEAVLYLQMQQDMMLLYHNLDLLLPDSRKRVIEFISSRQGEGTSTVVNAFARVAAKKVGGRVLILQANEIDPAGDEKLVAASDSESHEVKAAATGTVFRQVESNLHVCPVLPSTSKQPRTVNSNVIEDFWCQLREGFDLILVDSPPLNVSPEGVIMSRLADGIVLVLEAEKTRREIAEAAKEKLRKGGGNLLGVVFNKQRHSIPGPIYNKL